MNPEQVEKALIVGAGVMGHATAQVFAQAGIHAHLVDLDQGILARAMDKIPSNLETLAEFGRVSREEIPFIMERIHPSTDMASAAEGVSFALDCVTELPQVKEEVFSQMAQHCPQDAVLASNTSSLDIFKIVNVVRPERLIVAHWFAPPHIIPLVEVVPGPRTSPDVVDFTDKLMQRLGKKTVVMKEFVQAFIVNRIQHAVSRTVWQMLGKGWATPEEIDKAIKWSLGIRLPVVGVAQTADFTGLDLIRDIMNAEGRAHPLVEEKVSRGHLGVKTSRGVYDYGGRSEKEILRKRDERYLKMIDHLEKIGAFDPV